VNLAYESSVKSTTFPTAYGDLYFTLYKYKYRRQGFFIDGGNE